MTDKQNEVKRIGTFRTALPQFLACSAKNLVFLDLGMVCGYSTIVIPALLEGNDEIKFSREQASWFGNIQISQFLQVKFLYFFIAL